MSIYTYATTLQPATSVHTAIQGNFLSPHETSLIVSKGSRIEIYSLSNDLLTPTMDFDIYCRIESLRAITLSEQSTCSLFILSEQQTFCILHFDAVRNMITTKAHGNLEQKNARPNDDIFTAIDPASSTIMISAFTGLMFFIPLQLQNTPKAAKGKGKDLDYGMVELEPFDSKISEFNVKSMVAVAGLSPTFAILYEQDDGIHLKSYQVNLPRKQISPNFTVNGILESTCHLLIPVPHPYGGVLAIGEFTITYFDLKNHDCSLSIDTVVIKTYEFIGGGEDKLRCILGDTSGTLYMLTLGTTSRIVADLNIQYLGEAAACSSIVYLGRDMLYLGSPQGDSSLVKLEKTGHHSILTTVDEYPNLGPITDFCLYDLDKQGRQTMVCCSGANNDGTLRVVQSGIGFIERAVIPIDGIEHIWAISSSNLQDKSQHDILVLSSIRETRLLYHPGGDGKYMEELERFSAFDLEKPTLTVGTFDNGDIIQVTVYDARLMAPTMAPTMDSITRSIWKATATIVSAAVGHSHCVLSCGFGLLVCLKVDYTQRTLVEVSRRKFDHEISCLDIFRRKSKNQTCAAVGFWGGDNIQILDLTDLSTISACSIPEVPRSILFQSLQDEDYLFVALGDGKMVHYNLSPNSMELLHQNMITLGTRSISLHSFVNRGENVVLAATDRPTIISSVRNRLVYSSVNLKDVRGFTVFNNPVWKNSLLIMTEQAMLLGDMDPVRKLHFSKLPLTKKMGWRIAYHGDSQTIVVGTSQLKRNPDNGVEQKHGWVNVYDAKTFQELECFDLLEYELVETICSAKLFNQDQDYIFVGTAITLPSEPERSIGRILMYKVAFGRTYELVEAVSIPGVVYCIKPYRDSIVAAVNGSIYYLDSYHPDAIQGEKLKISQKIHSNVLALDLDTAGDSILVGDFMQSMSLMKLNDLNKNKMTTIAKDCNVNWMTAVKMASEDLFIGAEMSHNLFTLKKPATQDDTNTDEIMRMDVVGEYHIGDLINRMHRGTLADQIDPSEESKTWTIMYATVNGAIGTLTGITEQDYELLLAVQQRILGVLPLIGAMDHAAWRTFYNGARSGESRNYIDGDIVEKYLTLTTEQQHKVVESLPISVEQLQNKVEGLSQLR